MRSFLKQFGNHTIYFALALSCGWLLPSAQSRAESLQQYSATCAAEMNNVAVPDFNCSDGVEVKIGQRWGDDTKNECQNPPYLPGSGCYRGGRLGQIRNVNGANIANDIGILFLCRHKGRTDRKQGATDETRGDLFDDIAVIQTNYRTGATCFYQQIGRNLPGNVESPSQGGNRWFTPQQMVQPGNACAQCHDAGPFIRTPFIKKAIEDSGALNTGPDDSNHLTAIEDRRDHPEWWRNYWFPGADDTLGSWNGKVSYISTDRVQIGNMTLPVNCAYACHMIGANELRPPGDESGTGRWLAGFATGAVKTPEVRAKHGAHPVFHGKKPNNSKRWAWMEPHPNLRAHDVFKFFNYVDNDPTNYVGNQPTANMTAITNYWTKLKACADAASVRNGALPPGCSKTGFVRGQ